MRERYTPLIPTFTLAMLAGAMLVENVKAAAMNIAV